MYYFRAKNLIYLLIWLDFLAFALCFLVAAAVAAYPVPEISLNEFISIRIQVFNFFFIVAVALVWRAILGHFRLYDSTRLIRFREEAIDILKATSLGTGLLLLLSVIFSLGMMSKLFLVVFWASISTSMILGRRIFSFVLRKMRITVSNRRNVIIVGTNSRALRLAEKLERNQEQDYRVKGFVDDNNLQNKSMPQFSQPLLANLKDFHSLLRQHQVDEVIVCLPLKSFYTEVGRIAERCEEQGIVVRILADFLTPKVGSTQLGYFFDREMITVNTGAMQGSQVFAKRILDIVGSAVALMLLSPVMLLSALAIKMTSQGPIFFVQERVGFNKRIFRVYKFRTMVQDAEKLQCQLEHANEVKGAAFKISNDPRVTTIGGFMRKASVDELPQLWNVLKGDMSLVGPRPLPIRDYQEFREDWHRRRFCVKPGITCLWQISGRSTLSFDKWMELDMRYVDQWSLWLDLRILAQTVPAVLLGKGAT